MSIQSKHDGLDWRKASASGNNGCVELAPLPDGGVAVRDSKLGDDSPVLKFDRHEWLSFMDGLGRGEFDQVGRAEFDQVSRAEFDHVG
jgi:hypothetical protein